MRKIESELTIIGKRRIKRLFLMVYDNYDYLLQNNIIICNDIKNSSKNAFSNYDNYYIISVYFYRTGIYGEK